MDTTQNTILFGDTRKTDKLQKDRQAWEAVRVNGSITTTIYVGKALLGLALY